VTARLLSRRAPLGYVAAAALLGIIVLLGPNFVAQTLSQLQAGVEFTAGEAIGPLAGFGTVAVVGLWVLVAILRQVPGGQVAAASTVRSAGEKDTAGEAQPA
jgi:hypothetical protein